MLTEATPADRLEALLRIALSDGLSPEERKAALERAGDIHVPSPAGREKKSENSPGGADSPPGDEGGDTNVPSPRSPEKNSEDFSERYARADPSRLDDPEVREALSRVCVLLGVPEEEVPAEIEAAKKALSGRGDPVLLRLAERAEAHGDPHSAKMYREAAVRSRRPG